MVVFDRVRDNMKGIGSSGRLTYPQLINLSMNQTLARSINTSMVAIIPVLAILLIGAGFLGAQTLQSYGLALFVGLLSGAYSSIFIASPVLCMMKEREDRWVQIANRLAKRGDSGGWYSAVDAANLSTAISVAASGQGQGGRAPAPPKARNKRSGPIRPGSGSGASGGGTAAAGTAVMDRPSGGSAAGSGSGSGSASSGGSKSPGSTSASGSSGSASGSASGGAGASGASAGSQPSGSSSQGPRPRKGKGKRKR